MPRQRAAIRQHWLRIPMIPLLSRCWMPAELEPTRRAPVRRHARLLAAFQQAKALRRIQAAARRSRPAVRPRALAGPGRGWRASARRSVGIIGVITRECYGREPDKPYQIAADIAKAMQLGVSRTTEAVAPKIKEALALATAPFEPLTVTA